MFWHKQDKRNSIATEISVNDADTLKKYVREQLNSGKWQSSGIDDFDATRDTMNSKLNTVKTPV